MSPEPSLVRILVVDDDPVLQRYCCLLLELEGYQVLAADDGQAALDTLQTTPVDLVLMDLMMPGLDGLSACVELQADPRTSNIPVVILSAATHLMAARGAEIAGIVVAVLQKPFDPDELIGTVRQIVGQASR